MNNIFSHPHINTWFHPHLMGSDISSLCAQSHSSLLNQVHSSRAVYRNKPWLRKKRADAQRTDKLWLQLFVWFADCIPVLFYATEPRLIIGTIHAWWRGVQGNIIAETINQLKQEQIDINSLRCWIGPSVCPDCFEFWADGTDPYTLFDHDCITKNTNGLRNVDTRNMLENQLLQQWVHAPHISHDRRCTKETLELCSWRRDGIKGKNNYAWIEITQNEL